MECASQLPGKLVKGVLSRPGFWFILLILALITIPHYDEMLSHPWFITRIISDFGLSRPAFERVLYMAPIIWAGFLFGMRGAFFTSVVALVCMLPKAIFVPPDTVSALFEIFAVFILSNLVATTFASLRKEREYRRGLETAQRELESNIKIIRENEKRLANLNRIADTISQTLNLNHVLSRAADRVADVMQVDAVLVFLTEHQSGMPTLNVYRGISETLAQYINESKVGNDSNTSVAESGQPVFVEDIAKDSGLKRLAEHGLRSLLIAPLKSKEKVMGTLWSATQARREFHQSEVELLTAIGSQIGLAMENASLYEQVRESERNYRTIFDTTGTATVIIEEDTTISLANGEFERLSGYARSELEGKKSWTEFVVEDDLDRMKDYHRSRRIDPKSAPVSYEFSFIDKLGNIKSILLTIAMISGTQKSVASLLNVTNLKQAVKEKEISERKYRQLFENAQDAIWLRDLDGNIMEANTATELLTGYSMTELSTMNVKDLISEDSLELSRQIHEKLLANEAVPQTYEQRLIRKDRNEVYVNLSTNPISSNGRITGFQCVARNITEQKRMQENLQFYLHQITRAQEEERKRISHELHDETTQELVILSRKIDRLASMDDGLSDKTKLYLDELHQQIESVMQSVRRLSRDLRPVVLDNLGLVPAIERLATDVEEYSAVSTHLKVRGTPCRLSEEAELVIFRVTQEALRNMWKHAGATNVEVLVEFAENKTKVTVIDDGKGFEPPKNMSDLASLGKLGLAGMQERAQLIGGTIEVQSQLDKGTSVSIEVPKQPVAG
jgi:PAS domain S-box-containing protein